MARALDEDMETRSPPLAHCVAIKWVHSYCLLLLPGSLSPGGESLRFQEQRWLGYTVSPPPSCGSF